MSKITDAAAKLKLNLAKKSFSRNKALKEMTAENCGEERFTKHPNSHVKNRAAHLAAKNEEALTIRSVEES